MNIVLIDGDEVAYKAAFACETSIRWDEDTWVSYASERDMRDSIDAVIEGAMSDTNTKKYFVALSDKNNFRKIIDPNYKFNRNKVRKPVGISFCRDYISDIHNAKIEKELEADDVLAIEGVKNKEAVIWSVDKDFLTVPCRLYRKGKTIRITKKTAEKNLMLQTLIGDKVDNFEGAQGFGPVKANKWLDKNGYTWESVYQAFESVGQTKSDCTKNARLARILWKIEEKLTWEPKYATT
jgi:DNA polymerase-1|tara:strand:- start:521 stop:1234 length:714 start_codon:yes stop_codon:yes gene_type:complete